MLKLKKLYHGIVWAAIFFLFILAACNVIPRLFSIQPYIVLSGSMEPVLPTGSVVYMENKTLPEDMHVGDIISYRQGNIMITHRIVEESSSTVTTKGDANEHADFAPVSRDTISGKYVFHIPYLGYIYAKMATPAFYLCLFTFIGIHLIISNLIPHLITYPKTRKESSL